MAISFSRTPLTGTSQYENRLRGAVFLGALLLLTGTAQHIEARQVTQPVVWQQSEGPYGGDVRDLMVDPFSDRVWMNASFRLYFSDDHALSWTPVDLPEAFSRSLVFQGDGMIYENSHRSRDNGLTWERHGIPDSLSVRNMAIDPDTGTLVVATGHGIFRSTDSAETWTQQTVSETWQTRYGGTDVFFSWYRLQQPVVVRSEDGGRTWLAVGVPEGEEVQDFMVLDDGRIMMMTRGWPNTTLYLSEDNGASWAEWARGECEARAIAGFFSENRLILRNSSGVVVFDIAEQQCNDVFSDGYRHFTWGGRSWSAHGPVVMDGEGRIITEVGRGQLYRSLDGAESFLQTNMTGITGTTVVSLLVDERDGTILAGTERQGLFVSHDGGQTFEPTDINTDQIHYLHTGFNPGEYWLGSSWDGLFFSDDYGQSWSRVYEEHPYDWADLQVDHKTQTLYFTAPWSDIYTSSDNGLTWNEMNLRSLSIDEPPILGMSIRPDGSIVSMKWAPDRGTESGAYALYRTDDQGSTWHRMGNGLDINPWTERFFYMDSTDGVWVADHVDLYHSSDLGETWELAMALPGRVKDMLETPDNTLWMAYEGGLKRSDDAGMSWEEVIDGMGEQPGVQTLAWNNEAQQLLAGVYRKGVFMASLGVTGTDVEIEMPHSTDLIDMAVYPNPAMSQPIIQFTLQSASRLQIVVFDALGRRISTYPDALWEGGTHHLKLDLGNRGAGVYFVRIVVDGVASTRSVTMTS